MNNPQKRQDLLDNPIERSNPVNEPDYAHEEGYNSFNLTQPIVGTARFGEATPVSVFDTISADRHLVSEGVQMFMDEIQNRVMNEMRSYVDYFNVPMRCLYPNNWDKIIVHPNKGDDVPFTALPSVPLIAFFGRFLDSDVSVTVTDYFDDYTFNLSYGTLDGTSTFTVDDVLSSWESFAQGQDQGQVFNDLNIQNFGLARLLYLCFIVSRGQLLDNLGVSFDDVKDASIDHNYQQYQSVFQEKVDAVFNALLRPYYDEFNGLDAFRPALFGIDISSGEILTNDINLEWDSSLVKVRYVPTYDPDEGEFDFDLSGFRAALYECFEKGLYPYIMLVSNDDSLPDYYPMGMDRNLKDLYYYFKEYFGQYLTHTDTTTDFDEFFDSGQFNISRVVAYQQVVAEYMTNDHVDNIFSAELWMQNVRSLMFPSDDGVSSEPTFDYNGVSTEYDLFTTGAFNRAWFGDWSYNGYLKRILPFLSNVFIQRRSLRFKDYFASARPTMLAVGDLQIPVTDGTVSPIDTTKGLMMQRFFNAVNRWRRKTANYMASLFGAVPSDTGCKPAWIVRRANGFSRDTVSNTTSDTQQGKISTNLVSSTSDFAFDIFVDDFGVVVGLLTIDVLPYYPAGIDRAYRHYDRFSLFNPMLQNVGDQEIRRDELTGDINLGATTPFGYATRYAEYKQSSPRARGGFVNDIPARAFVYPLRNIFDVDYRDFTKISPDFIRDAPYYLDSFKAISTGLSPAQYYHMTYSVNNPHSSARKVAVWPGIL